MTNTIKNALCGWEVNGHDDSDGYVAFWDGAKVDFTLAWTTRGVLNVPIERATDPTVVAAAVAWLADQIAERLAGAEERDVMEPQDAPVGTMVRVLAGHTFNDKRRGDSVELKAGDVGRVFWCGAFGRFYRNGYNRPCRGNRRVGLELADGRRAFIPLAKLRLDREPASAESIRARALELARDGQFGKVSGHSHAWDTWNVVTDSLKSAAGRDR